MSDNESKVWRAIGIAAEWHRIPPAEIADGTHSSPRIVDARRTAFSEARAMGIPVPDIAGVFGLDPSTVYHHLRAENGGSKMDRFAEKPRPVPPVAPDLPPAHLQTPYQRMVAMAAAENDAMWRNAR